jgi:hypothetical protein
MAAPFTSKTQPLTFSKETDMTKPTIFGLSPIARLLCLIAAMYGVFLAHLARAQEGAGNAAAEEKEGKLYELRIYETNPGKLPDLNARFRDHTMRLFEKHGMENIIYWTVSESQVRGEEDVQDNLLVYVIAHKDEAAKDASWEAFINDPEWKQVAARSEENGKILAKAPRSILMRATDFSAADTEPNKDADAPARLFELRQYNDGPERQPGTVDRFATGEKDLFTKHGMETVKFWTATDDSAFIYLLAHKDRESSRESWQGFFEDFRVFMREYNARNEGQARGGRRGGFGGRGGRGGQGNGDGPPPIEVRFLVPTDYSPRK